jgi:transcriptional regulator with XRE-family HTH domain
LSIDFSKKVKIFVAFCTTKHYNKEKKGGVSMPKPIGEKIKMRRIELGWSLRELAKRMDYSNHSTVARIENGVIDIPQSKVVKFAEVMGTTVAFLMDWEEVQKNNDIISDAVVKMRTDSDFFSLVECLMKLDNEKQLAIKQMALALQK